MKAKKSFSDSLLFNIFESINVVTGKLFDVVICKLYFVCNFIFTFTKKNQVNIIHVTYQADTTIRLNYLSKIPGTLPTVLTL